MPNKNRLIQVAACLSTACQFTAANAIPTTSMKHVAKNTNQGHTTLIRPWSDDITAPSVQVTINGQPRWFIIDTGSSDLIVYTENTTCLIGGKEQPQSMCSFGDLYFGSYEPVNDMVYAQTFGTGQNATGQYGYATVEIAGVTVERQKVAFLSTSSPNQFNGTSGILGLSTRKVEQAFAACNPAEATAENRIYYDSVFESMYNVTKQIKPTFSIALENDPEGGYLTFGGRPPIPYNQSMTSVPMKDLNTYGKEQPGYYYPLQPDGYSLNGVQHSTNYTAIVDSGTYISRLPEDVADAINAAFDPPAKFDSSTSFYLTSCYATIPELGFTIGGKSFIQKPVNLLRGDAAVPNICATSVTKGFNFAKEEYPDGFYAFGDLFMDGLVVEFDLGENVIRLGEQLL